MNVFHVSKMFQFLIDQLIRFSPLQLEILLLPNEISALKSYVKI